MTVISKTPDERLTIPISVADELDGQAVDSVSATVVSLGLVGGPLLSYTETASSAGASLDISGGVDGEIYRIDVTITLDDEQILERSLEVHVLDLAFAVPHTGSPTSYISPAEYMDRFPIEELIQLTGDPHASTPTVNKKRFFASLQDASEWIDSVLAERYVVPVANPPKVLTAHAAAITRQYLHYYADGMPEHVEGAAKAAQNAIRGLANADIDLPGLELRAATVETPSWESGDAQFSDADLEGF